MCRVDSDDYADHYSTASPIARREHRCGECRRTILKGEQYKRHTIIADGTASQRRRRPCKSVAFTGNAPCERSALPAVDASAANELRIPGSVMALH